MNKEDTLKKRSFISDLAADFLVIIISPFLKNGLEFFWVSTKPALWSANSFSWESIELMGFELISLQIMKKKKIITSYFFVEVY